MSWLLVGFFPKCLTASLPTSQPFCSVKNRRENASLFHEYGPHLQQYIRRDVSYRLLVTMMKRNRSSAATVAFFIFFSCALHNCCVGSQAVATDAVESTQETDGEANANSATVVTTGELHPTEADQNDSGAAVLPKTSKETMLAASTTGLNVSVLAILALRLAMTHLHQGEEGTLNTSDVTGGIQRRRLSTRVPGNQRFASDVRIGGEGVVTGGQTRKRPPCQADSSVLWVIPQTFGADQSCFWLEDPWSGYSVDVEMD
ncbi:Toxoplasma gondii family B protein [Toxoplasma gondii GT1]|uniref:Toxoplasma gondii family B protein n=3 Tax=Toxoplasma gondii TaxID=5811 RepID=S7USZ2_TOXGG|nr:Toxoplasma gondii family B protein [Toxoplasma gondii GT1]KAF4639053.1 Toxoplasma gondii family B protein [Toxoplasma gondii]KFG99472.1 Toxoplasma gondii family B protein [Toxoplasma gondii VAND]